MQSIQIRHNIEVAHRLSLLPGKCQQIHGHSMWVELEMYGDVNEKGILEGIDFGSAKKVFRQYLDTEYDHHLLLNDSDPVATLLENAGQVVARCLADPTTENIARWIGERAMFAFGNQGIQTVLCVVHETSVNAATWSSSPAVPTTTWRTIT
jgi:6-pyruvoyltetrahydropterin/6-carboxytetrahydropterin synthase